MYLALPVICWGVGAPAYPTDSPVTENYVTVGLFVKVGVDHITFESTEYPQPMSLGAPAFPYSGRLYKKNFIM